MISRVQSEFTDEVIDRIANTVAAWRGEPDAGEYQDIAGFCRSVKLAEIAQHGHVLTPGRYVGARRGGRQLMKTLPPRYGNSLKSWANRWRRGTELGQLIRQKLGGLGYEF